MHPITYSALVQTDETFEIEYEDMQLFDRLKKIVDATVKLEC